MLRHRSNRRARGWCWWIQGAAGLLSASMNVALASGQHVTLETASPAARFLTLEESVHLALVNNLSLLGSADRVAGAQISEHLADSRFNLKMRPSFSKGVGSGTTTGERYGFEVSRLLPFGASVSASVRSDLASNNLGGFSSSNMELSVTQPLLRGFGMGATQFDLVNARRGLVGAERSFDLARQRLAVEVVASYYNIVRQQGLVDVAEKSIERSQELLRASERRLEVGLASKLDVFRAELQLSQAEESRILREQALEQALDTFKFKLGLSPREKVLLEMVEPEYQPVETDIDELTRQALVRRIELREEHERVDDARRALGISRQNLLPQLDLNVRYGQRGLGSSFGDSFSLRDPYFNVFLSTSYQLDRSSEAASFALSQIDVEARNRNLRLVEYNIANEVRASARNVQRLGQSILMQERNIDFAEKQLRLANLRYQRGLASNFDIIDAENNVIQARSNYVSLLADFHVSLIDLKRVTGTLDIDQEFAPGSFLPPARHHP